jgi:hypothetical protein
VEPLTRDGLNSMMYWIVGDLDGRSLGVTSFWPPTHHALSMALLPDHVTLRGRVVDPQDRPVVGARVAAFAHEGVVIPGVLCDTTDHQGEFAIERVATLAPGDLRVMTSIPEVRHPNFPAYAVEGGHHEPWLIRLAPGCIVEGAVVDDSNDRPIANAIVRFQRIDKPRVKQPSRAASIRGPDNGRTLAVADATGRFRVAAADGRTT